MKLEITSKCGEILRNGAGIYAFSCAFCNEQFDSTKMIIEHIENLHFMATNTEELCLEPQNTVTETEVPQTIFLNEFKIEQEEVYESTEPVDIFPLNEVVKEEDNLKIDNHPSAPIHNLFSEIPNESVKSTYKCLICMKELKNEKGLKVHLDVIHSDKAYRCPYCDKLIHARRNVSQHIRQSHKPIQVSNGPESELHYPCNVCDQTFEDLKDLTTHIYTHQQNRYMAKRNYFQCDICKTFLPSRASIYHHMTSKHISPTYSCPKCGVNYQNKSGLTVHMMRHTDSPYFRCAICSKVLFDKTEYDEHLKQHRSSTVECPKCNEIITSRPKFTAHLQSVHNIKSKYFKCSFCVKAFLLKSDLKNHKQTHKDQIVEREYTCEVCGKLFRNSTNLVVHLRMHRGEKLFKCTICEKSFSQSGHLKTHIRSHTGELPYKCELCDKAYRRCYQLTQHKRKWHLKLKPYKCQFCDRCYGDNNRKKEHERTHTGETPYECNICLRLFARSSNYRQHLLIHSDKKPYKCNYCDKTFTQAVGKYGHERNIHKKGVPMN